MNGADWRDFETAPPSDQDPEAEWTEVRASGKIKGDGDVRVFRNRTNQHLIKTVTTVGRSGQECVISEVDLIAIDGEPEK